LGATNEDFRGEQTLHKLHLVKGDISAKSPQAGSLAVLILYLQILPNKPANKYKPRPPHVNKFNSQIWLQNTRTLNYSVPEVVMGTSLIKHCPRLKKNIWGKLAWPNRAEEVSSDWAKWAGSSMRWWQRINVEN